MHSRAEAQIKLFRIVDHVDADRWILILTPQFEICPVVVACVFCHLHGLERSYTDILTVDLLFCVQSISGTCTQGDHLPVARRPRCKKPCKSDARAHLCKCYFGGNDLQGRYIFYFWFKTPQTREVFNIVLLNCRNSSGVSQCVCVLQNRSSPCSLL